MIKCKDNMKARFKKEENSIYISLDEVPMTQKQILETQKAKILAEVESKGAYHHWHKGMVKARNALVRDGMIIQACVDLHGNYTYNPTDKYFN